MFRAGTMEPLETADPPAPLAEEAARKVAGEVCHRAKNDLQTIANLLALAQAFAGSPQALAAAVEGRVGALSVCYSLVSEQGGQPTLDRVVEEVLRRLLWRQGGPALVERRVEPLPISLRLCSPLSLWLHEIIANALAHGLARVSQPRLSLHGGLDDQGGLNLVVGDNGPGLPPGFQLGQHARLGLKLAQAVAKSDLRGQMDIAALASGLEVRLRIPAPEFTNLNRSSWP